jgi:hypothetical protein
MRKAEFGSLTCGRSVESMREVFMVLIPTNRVHIAQLQVVVHLNPINK